MRRGLSWSGAARVAAALALAGAGFAMPGWTLRGGVVETVGGELHRGEIQLIPGGRLRVVAESGAAGAGVEVALGAVARASFEGGAGPLGGEGDGLASEGNGLLGRYFSGTAFEGSSYARIDDTVNFDWQNEGPFGMKDTFSVRWTGFVRPPRTGVYTFYLQTDDGGRLWIGERRLLERWHRQGVSEYQETVKLVGGQTYPVKLEYFEDFVTAVVRLLWSGPDLPKEVVPRDNLLAAELPPGIPPLILAGRTGLLGTYYQGVDLDGPSACRIDPALGFGWEELAPPGGLDTGRFAVRWSGQLEAPVSGVYRFFTETEGGVRFFLGRRRLVDAWLKSTLDCTAEQVWLVKGRRYDLRLEAFNDGGRRRAKLLWEGPGIPRSVVPEEQFSPTNPADGPRREQGYAYHQPSLPAGVSTWAGSFFNLPVRSADTTSLRFEDRAGADGAGGGVGGAPGVGLSTVNVARILFSPLRREGAAQIEGRSEGVLLVSGDFVEGSFRSFDGRVLEVDSVLFGRRRYAVPDEATAVVLRPLSPVETDFEVRTRDGSILRARRLTTGDGVLRAVLPALARPLELRAEEISELSRTGPREENGSREGARGR